MNRQVVRRMNRLIFGILILAGTSRICSAEEMFRPPNIVLIFTDDQRYDAVGYVGNAAVHTPNLDRLAKAGLVFQNGFVNTSICAVSRANIIAGQYPGRHGIDDFYKTFSREQLHRSVPGRLQDAGYQTAFFGKWGIGDSASATHEGAAAFDYWAGQPMQTCYFHESDCKYVNFDGFSRPLDDLCDCPADARGKVGFHNRIGKANLENPMHVDSEVIPLQVDRFLAERDPEKPFCMMLFFKGPHSPYEDWDPVVADVIAGCEMPLPEAATLENAENEPTIIKKSLGRPTGMRYLKDPQFYKKHIRDYYRQVSSMDLGVGRVMELLKERGLDRNTVILFTSDNGHFTGEHGLAGKWLMYEPSLRVPGFVYDPRTKPKNPVTDKMVITTDFSVTMLALAGLEKPADMTGRNLMPLFQGSEESWRKDFYYDHPYSAGGKIPRTIGVRDEHFAYTRYIDPDPPFEQLFDLKTDPNQLHNLAPLPEYRERLETMSKRCDELENAQRAGRKKGLLSTYIWNFDGNLEPTASTPDEGISVSALQPTQCGMDCGEKSGSSKATVTNGVLVLDRNGEASNYEWGFKPPFAIERTFFSFIVSNHGDSRFAIESIGGKSSNTDGVLVLCLYDSSGNDLSGVVNMAGGDRIQLQPPVVLEAGESRIFYIDFNSSSVVSKHRIDYIRIAGKVER